MLTDLRNKSNEHLAETGMTYWEHFAHVLRMMFYGVMALITSPLHAICPGLMPGVARDWMFKTALLDQLTTRPLLLKELQAKVDAETKL